MKKKILLSLSKGQTLVLMSICELIATEEGEIEEFRNDFVAKIRNILIVSEDDEITLILSRAQIERLAILVDCMIDEAIPDCFYDGKVFVYYDENGIARNMTVKEYFDSRLNSLL